MSSAIRDPLHGILNWRHGGGQSLQPPTVPGDRNRQPFEWRSSIGADESCTLVKQGNGLYAAKSPNGKSWLSRQPDGSLQERATSDASQPGPWECGQYDPSTHAWTPPHGGAFTVEGDQPANGGNGGSNGPSGPERGFLHTDGHKIRTEAGEEWGFFGYTMHTLPTSAKNGDDLSAILADPIVLGYNVIVTIGTHLSQWKKDNGFYLDPFAPGYQEALTLMFDTCALKGLRVAHAALADCQGLNQQQIQHIWDLNVDVARGRWNVLLRVGNEDLANGYDCGTLNRPSNMGGVLCSRGSRGIDTPPHPSAWDFIEWEGRRDPMHKALDDSGSGVLELLAGYDGTHGHVGPFSCPVIHIEPPFFHDTNPDMYGDGRWTSPADALTLGAGISLYAPGGAFGCSNGLVCRPIGNGVARECGEQFIRGLRAGFVR